MIKEIVKDNVLERLNSIEKELSENIDIKKNRELLMEHDSIINYYGGGKERYSTALEFIKMKGLERVFDIGCGYGFQSELFINSGINYVGIDGSVRENQFFNKDKATYLSKVYPFDIEAKNTDLALSVLCLTWNCYLFNGAETYKQQMEQLSRDFKHVILYMNKADLNFVKSYFKGYESIEGTREYFNSKFYYFYN